MNNNDTTSRRFSPESLAVAGGSYLVAHDDEARTWKAAVIARAIADDICINDAADRVEDERVGTPCRLCGSRLPWGIEDAHNLCIARDRNGRPTPPLGR